MSAPTATNTNKLMETKEEINAKDDQTPEDAAVVVPRLVRWDWCCDGVHSWELSRSDGTVAATVWENGVWHTWDHEGCGGENSSEETVSDAKVEAMLSAFNRGFLSAND